MLNLTFPTSNQLRPLVSPPVTTTYTVTGGIGQCADASSVTVTVTPRILIPSAISPNGDGVDEDVAVEAEPLSKGQRHEERQSQRH